MNNQKALTKEQIKQVGHWEGDRFFIYPYYQTSTSELDYGEWTYIHTSEYYASLSEDQLATLNKVYIGI